MRNRWGLMLGMLAAVILAGAWKVQAQGTLVSTAMQDAQALAAQAQLAYDAETQVRVVLKASGPYRSYTKKEELLSYGQELSRALGMKESSELREQQGEALYQQERMTADGCKETLLLTWWEDKQTFVIVKKECSTTGATLQEKLTAWQQSLESDLKGKADWEPVWQVMVQGELSYSQQAQSTDEVLGGIAAALSAVEAERYEDRGTVSISYSSRKLKQSVISGKHEIHLQAGLHTDSTDGTRRLTLGTPMITTEY